MTHNITIKVNDKHMNDDFLTIGQVFNTNYSVFQFSKKPREELRVGNKLIKVDWGLRNGIANPRIKLAFKPDDTLEGQKLLMTTPRQLIFEVDCDKLTPFKFLGIVKVVGLGNCLVQCLGDWVADNDTMKKLWDGKHFTQT